LLTLPTIRLDKAYFQNLLLITANPARPGTRGRTSGTRRISVPPSRVVWLSWIFAMPTSIAKQCQEKSLMRLCGKNSSYTFRVVFLTKATGKHLVTALLKT
jgi:hypothetical protein